MALCRPSDWDTAEACSQEAVEQAASDIEAAGAEVVELKLPTDLFGSWLDDHRRIANFEAARNYGHEKTLFKEKLSKDLYEGRIANGERCTVEEYIAAQRKAEAMRAWMDDAFEEFDAVLTLSSAGEAPRGLANTGDARFNSLWTLLYTPCLNIPARLRAKRHAARHPADLPPLRRREIVRARVVDREPVQELLTVTYRLTNLR